MIKIDNDRWKKIKKIEEDLDRMWSDPELPRKVEEFQRKHGVLTPEELHQRLDTNLS